MHTLHATLQFVLLCGALFFTFDAEFHPIHRCYRIALFLNAALLLFSLMVDVILTNFIGKRLILWFLYYEFITPLVFIFLYLFNTQSSVLYMTFYFLFYLATPLLYFSMLTFESIVEFLKDSPYHATDSEEYST